MRHGGTTTQRGYGHTHQTERKRRLVLYRPGDICAMGGEPLSYPRVTAWDWLDLAHDHANGGYLPGLSCRTHNRGEGATRGNRMWQRQWRGMAASRSTRCGACGQPYHYPAAICGICGRHYHPSRKIQYTCSTACGWEYRRKTAIGW